MPAVFQPGLLTFIAALAQHKACPDISGFILSEWLVCKSHLALSVGHVQCSCKPATTCVETPAQLHLATPDLTFHGSVQ